MNRIYRSIWNQATGAYAAVSENVKSAGKRSMPGSAGGGAHFALTSMAAALMLGYGSLALAGPTGGTVVAGQANITGAPGSTVINQGSQNAVINWAQFNINKGESVQFVQPNSNAVALNRVLGNDGTTILGNLSANGKVFIVNPNGILFGQGASVNTAGLVASTLDISNADFMAGNYKFSGNGTGKVLNQGALSAPGGYVALLGANVSNEGTINARLGSVALAAGNAITLDVAGDGLLNVAVDRGAVGALVQNGGLIQADGGSVVLTAQAAGNLLKTVVNNTGVIEAHTIDTRGGTIKLLGDMQSGTVNAAGTLDASAPDGGNGGFVDTSAAHVKLDDALRVTTAATKGLTGTWLIDPTDYTIAATGGDQTGAFYTNVLKSTSVQIQSISGGTGTAGDINVNDTISWSANQLKMTAQNNININQPLRGSGTASLALEYGQANVAAGNGSKYNVKAEIDLPSGLNFSTKLGSDATAVNYTVINSLGAASSTSGTDLQGLKNALTGNFVLGANIDASGTANTAVWGANGFTPIGTTGTAFSGQFDGLGHVITGLNSSTTSVAGAAGLFGSNTGSIRNIGLVAPVIAANITGTQGNAAALAAINSGTISNAYVSGGSVTVTIGAIGAGLVGLNSGTISDSYNSSKVSVVGNYDFWMGGLVGNTTKTSTVINSYNTGEVVGAYTAGGLVGNNLGNITNSFNSGNVSGTTSTAGLTSRNGGTGVITNSFNTGAVTGNSLTGGLVGTNVTSGQILNSYSTGAVTSRSTTGTGFGGLAGGNSGIIRNSYATGAVTGVTAVGGLIGANTSAGLTENAYASGAVSLLFGGSGTVGGLIGSIGAGTSPSITGGYYNTTLNPGLSGVGTNSGTTTPAITGLTASQMQVAANFGAFTFTTTTGATGNNWVMVNTDGTLNGAGNATGATGPMLAAEYSSNIYSSHQLQLMAMNLAGNYTLKQDINAASTGTGSDVWNGGTFVPVGASTSARFTGSFDGAGHVISGLVVNRPGANNAGLFGVTSGTAIVRNVGLEGGSVTGANATGALVGLNLGLVDGSYSTVSVTGGSQVGGLVGLNGTNGGVPGIVSNSYASGAVSGTGIIGGLVGSNSGTLTNNYASGAVSGGNTQGGLTGDSNGSATGNFWDTTTSGMATSGTGTGLTTAQMKLLSTYSGASWDLAGAWIVYDTNTYPLLRAFMTPLQVTFAAGATKTYDGTANFAAPSFTYSNPNASLSGSLNYGAAGSAVNAGTYAITAGGLYSGQHGYAINANAVNLVINKLAATLSGASVASRAYDGTTAATLAGGTLSGVLAQDSGNVTYNNTGTFDTKDAGIGKTVTAIVTGSASGNYTVTGGALTGTITPKALTLSGLAATTRQYDGGIGATLTGGTLSGLIGSETLGLGTSIGVFADKNAGAGKAVTVTAGALADGSGLASNYTVTAPIGVTGAITAKTLSWVNLALDPSKEYDGNTTASINKGSVTGLVSGEALKTGSTATYADKNAGNSKVVTVHTTLGNGSGGLASNYTLADASLTSSITPKALTVTGATAGNKVYDGTLAASITGGTLSGMIGSETVGLGALSGAFGDKNAGTGKAVTVGGGTLSDGTNGGLAGNYTVASVTGLSANITQKALTVSGVAVASKAYDGDTAATVSGGTLNGLVSGETLVLSGQTGVFADKNAGAVKAVTVSGATLADGSGLASNYTVSNTTGATGTITQKALTVSGMTASDKVYDGGTAATLSGGALAGMVGTETLGLSGLSGVFGDKNAGAAKAVTVTGGALSDGSNGGLASNYTFGAVTGLTASITQKALTLSGLAASAKAYDGNNNATLTGGTLSGMVGGETVSVSGQTGTFSDKNAATGKVVTVTGTTLVDGSGLASNYSLANPTGVTGDITKKALTISGITATNRAYTGGTAVGLGGTVILDGLVGAEGVGVGGMVGVFADKNVGTGKAVTITGAVMTVGSNGGQASNYTISNPTGVTANITKATISAVTSIVVDSKAYDGGLNATVNAAGATFGGIKSGDSLTVSATTATYADKNVGTGKTVTISGIGLGGTDAGNYNLTTTTGSSTGAITPKALTIVGMSAVSKVYDGNTKASVSGGSIDGLVGSETLGVTGLTVTFDDKNAGTAKSVTATGTTLVNGGNGGLASNYTMANPTGFTANITPKALTVTGMTAGTKVYDGTTAANLSGGSLSGVISGETLVLSGGSGVFVDKNAGVAKSVTVSGVSLADGTGLASNYSVNNPTSVKGTITQKALTVSGTLAASDKVYDGLTTASLSGGTLSGFVGTETVDLAGLSGTFSDKNAGSGKTVTVSGGTLANGSNGGLAGNYSVSASGSATASITQKALTVTGATAADRVYDGTLKASVSGGTLSGMVGTETLGLSGLSGAFVDKNVGTAKTVTVSGAALADGTNGGLAGNYSVASPSGLTAAISRATISSVSNIVADSKTYDGNTKATVSATGATFNGMVAGDSLAVSATSATFADKNAGNGKTVAATGIALAGTDAANYNLTLTTASGTGNITQKALTIVGMSAVNKVYDGNTKASVSGGSISGLVGSETLGVTGLTVTFDDKNAGTAKSVTATGTTLVNGGNGGLASNYSMANPTGFTANITPKALTVSGMTAGTKVYDGTTAATLLGGSLSGVVTGETLVVSGGSGVFADKNAGNGKAVTVSGVSIADGTGLASNYSVTNPANVTGSITQKALTVSGTLLASDKTYDGNTTASISGGTLSGFVGTETVDLAGLSGTFSDKNAASGKTVTVSGGTLANGTNGGLASNYSVSVGGSTTASITQKALSVTGVAAANKVYDSTTKATVTGGALNGLVGSETLGLSGLSGVFVDKNAGTGKTVTVSGATLADGTGLASNYTVSNPTTVTANINQATINTVSNIVADSKVYDANTKATVTNAGATFGGLFNGDALSVSATSATFADKNAGSGKTVTASGLTLGGTDAGNYNLTAVSGTGTGTITPKALTIVGMSAVNKVYDGNTKASVTGGSISGLVGSETLGVTGLTVTFDDKNAGTGKAVTATGTTLVNGGNGGLASNYSMANPTGFTANITPKALTVSGMTAGTRAYDGSTTATLNGGALSGLVSGETLVVSGGTGVFADKNAGNGKAVTVSGVGLLDGTGLASNYTVSNPTGVTGSITQKALSVTGAVALDKTYDGTQGATITGGTLSGLVGTETVSLASLAGAFADKNAGSGKAVSVTGGTLSNGSNGGLASNYSVGPVIGLAASIAQKALSVTGVMAGNKVYDSTTKATVSGGALDGLVAGETLGLSGLSGAFGDKNAGTGKAVIVSGAQISDGTGLASNYTVSNPIGVKADIAKANITGVTGLAAGTKVYDATTTASVSNAGATFAGMFNGDALNVSATSANFVDKNAGSGKAVNASGLTLGGTDAGNYNLTATTGTGTGTITQAQITGVTGIIAGSKTYDATTTATVNNAGATFAGLFNGDSLSVSATSATFADKNAGSGKTVNASGLTLGGTDAGNYNLTATTGTGTGTITQAQIASVTGITAAGKTYDGTDTATLNADATFNGVLGSDSLSFTATKAAFSDKNAGAGKTVNVSGIALGGVDAGNYTLASNTGTGTGNIAKANITGVTGFVAGTKVYDTTTKAAVNGAGATFAGMVNGDVLSVSATDAAFTDKNAGSGKTVNASGLTLGGTDAGNYSLTATTGTGTGAITQAQITGVTGIAAGSKTYDATTAATVNNAGATFAGLFNGDSLSVSATSATFADKNAGSGKTVNASGLTLGGTDAGNYNLTVTTGTGTGTITQAQIASVTGITAAGKTYDGTDTATLNAGATFNGVLGSDSLSFTATKAAFSDKNAGTGKAVNVSGIALGGADAGNYTLASNTGTGSGDIARANITGVTGFAAGTKVYDTTTKATVNGAGATFAGMVNGDVLSVSATDAAFTDKNAGSGKTVNASGLSLGGTDAGNYNLTATTSSGTGTITQAQIASVTGITAAGKTYDGTDTATLNAGATFNGVLGSDSLSFTASKAAFSDKNAGTGKTVNVEGIALGGLDAGNYVLADAKSSGTGTITPKALTISGQVAGNKVYDGNTAAQLSAGVLNGLVGSESLAIGGQVASFSGKDAGTAKTVTVTGTTLVDTSTGLASNYTVSNPTGLSASITPKALTVAGQLAGNKVYDGNTAASLSGGALSGLVAGETLGLAGQSAVFGDKNAANGKTVTVSGTTLLDTATGLASNYTVSNPTGLTASITAKALTVTGQLAGNKVYDGNTQASLSGGALSGLVAGETLGLAGQTAVFSDKNAANGKTVTVSGTTLLDTATGLASNYTVSNPTGLTASITAKALTVTGQLAGNKVYDGNTVASLSGGALSGLVAGETLGFGGQSAVFSDKNAANGKAVTVTSTTLVDTASGLASNYTVSNPTDLTASITAKALTVTGQLAGNKVYDGNAQASLSGGALSGLVGGETLGFGGQSAVFSDKNAANGKTVTVSGTTLVDTSTGLASNYTVSNPTGLTASITAKALTVTGQLAGNKVYDGNAQTSLSGGALSGLVAGETLGFGGQTAVFSDKNAANGKTVTVTGTTLVDTASGLASNYTVSNPTGLTASITAKALTVTGQLAGNKVYDGNTQASLSGGTLSGLVGGETLGLAGQSAVFSDKNAANGKTVTVTGTTLVDTASGLASNYTVSNPTGLTASITPKALTVTGQLAGNKVYDGNTAAQLSGGSLSGLVAGETLSIGGQSAAFADKNAGTAKAVTVTGTTLVDTSSGLARNYTVSNPTGLTASITPKALTVAGQLAGNKVYDGNTAAQLSGGVLAGLVAGESLGLAGQVATFADKNAASAKAVTVTGTTLVDTNSGLARNYTVSNPTGLTASITPASLLVRATGAASRVYDTTTNARVTLSDNRIAGDVLTISNSGARFADKNAGANKTVTVNGIALGGTDAGNYTVNATATTSASITQAALGVKVNNAEKDQGLANPAFTASYTGLIASDTLANEVSGNLAFSTPATTGTPSGSYLVSAAGQTSTNYALTYTPGVLTVKPTEALQSAVASVLAAVNVAPSQGNMVQAEVVSTGEKVDSKVEAVAVAKGEPEQGTSSGTDTSVVNTPAVQLAGTVTTNVLPGLRLNVVDSGLRLPSEAGNTSIESQ